MKIVAVIVLCTFFYFYGKKKQEKEVFSVQSDEIREMEEEKERITSRLSLNERRNLYFEACVERVIRERLGEEELDDWEFAYFGKHLSPGVVRLQIVIL